MRVLLLAGILCLGIAAFVWFYLGVEPVTFTVGATNVKVFRAVAPAILGIILVTIYILRSPQRS